MISLLAQAACGHDSDLRPFLNQLRIGVYGKSHLWKSNIAEFATIKFGDDPIGLFSRVDKYKQSDT